MWEVHGHGLCSLLFPRVFCLEATRPSPQRLQGLLHSCSPTFSSWDLVFIMPLLETRFSPAVLITKRMYVWCFILSHQKPTTAKGQGAKILNKPTHLLSRQICLNPESFNCGTAHFQASEKVHHLFTFVEAIVRRNVSQWRLRPRVTTEGVAVLRLDEGSGRSRGQLHLHHLVFVRQEGVVQELPQNILGKLIQELSEVLQREKG